MKIRKKLSAITHIANGRQDQVLRTSIDAIKMLHPDFPLIKNLIIEDKYPTPAIIAIANIMFV